MDEARNRYLRDRVMTASPAQRVVMLYDRLALDLKRAGEQSDDATQAGAHVGHATAIVGELYGSLDVSAGGPADNLASLYSFLLGELTRIRTSGEFARVGELMPIVDGLRDAFATVAANVATAAVASSAGLAAAASAAAPLRTMTSWVG